MRSLPIYMLICTSMLASSIYRKHSTAQSAPLHKAAKQADRVARASMSSSIYIIQLAEFAQRTKGSKSARLTKISNHSRSSLYIAGVMRGGCAFVSNLNKIQQLLFLSVPPTVCISYMHAAPGLFSWSMELLAFATRQFAPKIVDLSVRFIRFFVPYISL